MNMTQFIRSNRAEIDDIINRELYRRYGRGGRGVIPDPPPKRNDDERRQWIMNDEGLYSWARQEMRHL